MEFLNLIVNTFFWALLLLLALRILAGWTSRHIDDRLEQINAEIEEIKKVYKRVKIEQHHDIFYLFDADTDTFIGQGRTMQEIADRVRGEMVLNVMEGDPDVVKRFRDTFPQTDPA